MGQEIPGKGSGIPAMTMNPCEMQASNGVWGSAEQLGYLLI